MKKIILIFLSFLITFILTGCAGYKPIFAPGNLKFEINDHKIEGNTKLGNQFFFKIKNLSKINAEDQDKKSLNFIINISKDNQDTGKGVAIMMLKALGQNSNFEDMETEIEEKYYPNEKNHKIHQEFINSHLDLYKNYQSLN